MTDTDAESLRVELQANQRRKINLLPDAELHESDLQQCEILLVSVKPFGGFGRSTLASFRNRDKRLFFDDG